MPKGQERILIYVRERDAAGRTVIRAVPAGSLDVEKPDPPRKPGT